MANAEMYNAFSANYDYFVDWPGRLAVELPFIEQQLKAVAARGVLDVACGTGKHALALAERGYAVVGVDLSSGMIERARANAAAAGVDVRFEVAGFGELAGTLLGRVPPLGKPGPGAPGSSVSGRGGREPTPSGPGFDAVLCLGNSLPHVLTRDELAAALADFAACLRPGGLLLIQNRNFDAVTARRDRWMPLQAHQEAGQEWLFVRFYDFKPDGRLTFNMLTLQRQEGGDWTQHLTSTGLWPLTQRELTAALEANGFGAIAAWGDMQGGLFDSETSGNLVVTARKR